MGKDISDYLYNVGDFISDVSRDIAQRCEDEVVQKEQNNGVVFLTNALLEAKVEEKEIIRLIQKYYGLSEREAEELMIGEKTINMPCQELETYLVRSEGYTRDEAFDFIFEKGIPDILRENKEFWKLSPEQLLSKTKRVQ